MKVIRSMQKAIWVRDTPSEIILGFQTNKKNKKLKDLTIIVDFGLAQKQLKLCNSLEFHKNTNFNELSLSIQKHLLDEILKFLKSNKHVLNLDTVLEDFHKEEK